MKKMLKYVGTAALALSLALFAGCAADRTTQNFVYDSGVVKAFAAVTEDGLVSKTARADGENYRVTTVTATSVYEYSLDAAFHIERTTAIVGGKQAAALTEETTDPQTPAEPETSTDPQTPEPQAPAASVLERAYAEALRLSGIAEADVDGFDFDKDSYMGKDVFKVEIEDLTVEYTYIFDAETFALLTSKTELRHTMSETESSYIGETRAKAIALEAVGIDAAAADGLTVKSILSEGRRVYKVSLNYDGYRYEAAIDALTGDIAEFSKTLIGGSTGPAVPETISEEQAKEIALAFAFPQGAEGHSVTFRKVKMDYEDGAFLYEVEFFADGSEYELEIAADGTILDAEIEREDDEEQLPQGKFLTKEEAMQAVKVLIGEGARIVDVELESEGRGDGKRFYYEVEVVDGAREYEYTVDAVTGAVTKQGEQQNGAAAEGLIGEEEAIRIALERFSLTEKEARVEKVKLERDDGRYIYEVELRVKSIEYEVEIDAKTGKILESDISYD